MLQVVNKIRVSESLKCLASTLEACAGTFSAENYGVLKRAADGDDY